MNRFLIIIAVLTILPRLAVAQLEIRQDTEANTISVFRAGESEPILTQNARPDFRPFIHPIVAPDGAGVLTQYSPTYNPHQTGLYWGFTSVNGRDFFHHPEETHWKRVSMMVLKPRSTPTDLNVRWQTVYQLLAEDGSPVMLETQIWNMREQDGTYILDLKWSGTALTDITIGEFDYGGMFLRMPWDKETNATATNGVREVNQDAEGRRAVWLDLGVQLEGRDDQAHIAIFDHPKNEGYPQPWRVDTEFGVGPVRARLGDWSIGAGETAEIQHQLWVYTGKFSDLNITETWADYTQRGREKDIEGKGIPYAQWGLAKKEGYEAEFLTPDRAVAEMTVNEDFEANVYASEPMITQPMSFCWDDRGRLWIAENRDMMGSGEGIQDSRESKILILEDTDGDGVADTKKVFLDGIVFPSAIKVGFDGLYVGAPPNLLFVPDRNHDDKADEEDIEVLLTGWGDDDLHETLNSFHWGPDGWLYGLQGVFTPSRVGKPAGESAKYSRFLNYPDSFEYADEPIDINGGVWRYHPTKRIFEVFAHGFSNPWGIDFDANGQFFITACVIPHLWHVVHGGLFHRQAGSHFNPNAYGDIRTIGDHRHRSAHGGSRVYQSDAFPEEFQGKLFMGNIHEHAVLVDNLKPAGSGFVGEHDQDFMKANNAQFVGFSTEVGPDGAVYMLDWHDADICGDAVRTKDTGRVYRFLPKESLAENWDGRYDDVRKFSNAELVDLQKSASDWHARRARVVLQNRARKGDVDSATHNALREIFEESTNDDHRLRALWALHVTQGIGADGLVEALNDEDEYVRAWAVQLLCEDKDPSGAATKFFAKMAKEEQSAPVRLYLASALQRMDFDDRWDIAKNLVAHAEDADDHNIPKILWYGIEPLVVEDPEQALRLGALSRIPEITRNIARRLATANQFTKLVDEIGNNADTRNLLLMGMLDGLEGSSNASAPANWPKVYNQLRASNDESAPIALQLSLQFGDAVAAEALLDTLAGDQNTLDDRLQAIRGLAGLKRPELKPQLLALLDDEVLRTEAIRASASYDDDAVGEALLERYPNLSDEDKLEVVHAMSARPGYGTQLTQAISSGYVPKRDVPAYIARLMLRVVGNRFLEVWGPVEGLSPDSEAAFGKFQDLLTNDALAEADLRAGREVYNQTCYACHQLYGEGGLVGPDLTGANRTDLTYLLGNILTPSAVIKEDYKMTMVFTEDGQVYSGVVAGEDRRQLQLRVANVEEPISIAKSQITDREITDLSMMPEGLLDYVEEQDIINLFAYLQSLEPISMQDMASR